MLMLFVTCLGGTRTNKLVEFYKPAYRISSHDAFHYYLFSHRAVKGGPNNCSCECQCFPGWTGDNCECANTNVACAGIDGLSCSGRGECICGACECNLTSGYGGPTCSDCISVCHDNDRLSYIFFVAFFILKLMPCNFVY